jgi:hypothetical protein
MSAKVDVTVVNATAFALEFENQCRRHLKTATILWKNNIGEEVPMNDRFATHLSIMMDHPITLNGIQSGFEQFNARLKLFHAKDFTHLARPWMGKFATIPNCLMDVWVNSENIENPCDTCYSLNRKHVPELSHPCEDCDFGYNESEEDFAYEEIKNFIDHVVDDIQNFYTFDRDGKHYFGYKDIEEWLIYTEMNCQIGKEIVQLGDTLDHVS